MVNCSRLFILSVSDIFFAAYSDAKLLLFFVALGIYFGIKHIWGQRIIHQKINIKLYIRVLYILIVVLFISGILSYFYTIFRFGIPYNHTAVLSDNAVWTTVNGLFHMHTLKPAVTWLLIPLGFGDLKTYGSAIPFWTLMPEMRGWYIGVFFLLSLASYMMITIGIVTSYKRKTVWFDVAYVVFAYGLLKVIVDGGALWYEAHIYLLFYSLILFLDPKKIRISWKSVGLFVLGVLVYSQITHIAMRLLYRPILTWEIVTGQFVAIYAAGFSCLAFLFLSLDMKKGWKYGVLLFVIAYALHLPTPQGQAFIAPCIQRIFCSPTLQKQEQRIVHILEGTIPTHEINPDGTITKFISMEHGNGTYEINYWQSECDGKHARAIIEYLTKRGVKRFVLL